MDNDNPVVASRLIRAAHNALVSGHTFFPGLHKGESFNFEDGVPLNLPDHWEQEKACLSTMLLPMSKNFSCMRFVPVFAFFILSSFSFAQQVDPGLYSGLRWRMIGPHRGGRTIAVSGIEGQPNVYFFGGVGGGVWKTTNGGITWEPIFDSQPISSIGAIAIAPSNPGIIYVGTGEADFRSNLTYGNG